MVNIKNTSPLETALLLEGQKVEFGDIIDVPKDVADYLIATPNFSKASLDDAKKKKGADNSSSTKPKGATQ
jgi:hypothetical protein